MLKVYCRIVAKELVLKYILIYTGVKVIIAFYANGPETLISVGVSIVKILFFAFYIF
jgi:hypothetical protein